MRRIMLLVAVAALTAAVCAPPVLAQDSAGRGTVCKVRPKPHSKGKPSPIQAAVNKKSCATILLSPGTYKENVTIRRDVTIRGVKGDERTIVHGGGRGPVFDNSEPVVEVDNPNDLRDGSTVTLEGLTVTGGKAKEYRLPNPTAMGGGIFNCGSLTLIDSTVRGNTAGNGGGGIGNYRASVVLDGSTVRGNTAGNSGGGIYGYYSGVVLDGSAVRGNTAGGGGGIGAYRSVFELNDSTVRGNTAAGLGGAIANSYGKIVLDNSTISGNKARDGGGGFYIGGYVTLEVNDGSTIEGNTSQGDGGGVLSLGENGIDLSDSTVRGNTARGDGGGIWGGATLSDSTVSGNTAGGKGGGVYLDTYAKLTLLGDSAVENNSPDDVYDNNQ